LRLLHELRNKTRPTLLLAWVVLTGAAGGVMIVLQARILSLILGQVIFSGGSTAELRPLFIGLVVTILIRYILAVGGDYLASSSAILLKNHLRGILFKKIFQLGPAFMSEERSGELSAALSDGIEAMEDYYGQYLPQLVLAGVIPLLILLFVFPLDLLTGIVLLLTAPLIPVFMILIGKNSEKLTHRQWTALSRMSAFFLDTLQGLKELKIFGRSREQGEKIREVSERYQVATMNVMRVTFLSALTLEWVATLSTAVIAVEIGLRLLGGGLEFEQAFFILVIAPDFYLPLRQLGARFHAGMAGISAARKIYEILDRPVLVRPIPTISKCIQEWGFEEGCEIELKRVSFSYPGRKDDTIKNLSLTIKKHQYHALAGRSGAGKSTIAALLLRFIHPDQGRILVNGFPLDEIPLGEWRKVITWVPQKPFLFHSSLADNIRLGMPEATLEQVHMAAEQAHLAGFIESLPQGYDTIIGEGGARLSGGQAQRLAIARAFLLERPFLIMDEPTAHLDLQLELDLEEAINTLVAGRTTLVIAHRRTSLQRADFVHFIEDGRVLESGSYQELVENKGKFFDQISNKNPGISIEDMPQSIRGKE
jgi:ATP-binding cassette, subfamily C, bacterial CydD